MEKQIKVGSSVMAMVDGPDLRKGAVYLVSYVYDFGGVDVLDDAEDEHCLCVGEFAPAQKFKAGDKARITCENYGGAWAKDKVVTVTGYWDNTYVIVTGQGGETGHITEDKLELVTEPQNEFVVTRVYPNGGFGVTHYFATVQEAREYLQKSGNADGGYKFSRLVDSQMLKVQEVSTVTRAVVPA